MADGTDIDPQALEALRERIDADGDEERDEDLTVFLQVAWPTRTAQDN